MDRLSKILGLLDYTHDQLEDRIMVDWLQWCMAKSYVTKGSFQTQNSIAVEVELSTPDLQNLMADSALFNYFQKMYVDCMLDFLEDTEGMNPKPSVSEARTMYKNCIINCFRLYNVDLIKEARTKKIVEHVNN